MNGMPAYHLDRVYVISGRDKIITVADTETMDGSTREISTVRSMVSGGRSMRFVIYGHDGRPVSPAGRPPIHESCRIQVSFWVLVEL